MATTPEQIAAARAIREHAERLKSSMDDNNKFDQAIAALRGDKSMKKEHVREIHHQVMGYPLAASKAKEEHIQSMVNRQMLHARGAARAKTMDKSLNAWGKE